MNSDEVVKEAVLRSVLNDPPNISSNSAHEVRATLVADTGCHAWASASCTMTNPTLSAGQILMERPCIAYHLKMGL